MIRRLLLATIILELPVRIDKNFFYNQDLVEYGGVGGLDISLTTICLGILYVMWIPKLLVHRQRFVVSPPLVIYLMISGVSLIVASNRLLALFMLATLIQAFLLYFYVANNVRTRSDVSFICTFLLLGLLIHGMFMGAAYVVGGDINLGPFAAQIDESSGRVFGTSGANSTGSYFCLLLAPALSMALGASRQSFKAVAAAAFALGVIGVILTQSRGAVVGTAFSLTIAVFLAWHRGWLPPKFMLIGGMVTACCILAFQDVLLQRFLSDRGAESALSRAPLNEMAFLIIQDHPLWGVGANNCATVGLQYWLRPEFREHWFFVIHNKYLLTWLEIGFFGLLAFVAFLFHTLVLAWRTWRRDNRFLSLIALGFGAAVAGQMIHMGVAIFSGRSQVMMLWLVAALLMAIYHMHDAPEWERNDRVPEDTLLSSLP